VISRGAVEIGESQSNTGRFTNFYNDFILPSNSRWMSKQGSHSTLIGRIIENFPFRCHLPLKGSKRHLSQTGLQSTRQTAERYCSLDKGPGSF